jgi:hypothetical protein
MKKATVTMWDKRDEFIEIFPELEETFDLALKDIETCSSCHANSRQNRIIADMVGLYVRKGNIVMPDKLRDLIDPGFSQGLAHRKSPSGSVTSYTTKTKTGKPAIRVPKKHSHDTRGYRPSCLDCVCKHLAQAMVLFQEAESPEYRVHFWLAVGHMAEAESESISDYYQLATDIRTLRLTIMEDRDYKPNLVDIIEQVESLKPVK